MVTPALIVVGSSMGGGHALQILLKGLPKKFPVPVIIAQHRGKDTNPALSVILQDNCALPVCEPEDKEAIVAGRVYIAPADYHLLVEPGSLALSMEGPVNHARPSVDVLFESAAEAYGDTVIAVVLTGANQDGARGAATIKARGGMVIVQDPATAERPEMPAAAIKAAPADQILLLAQIAPFVVGLCAGHAR